MTELVIRAEATDSHGQVATAEITVDVLDQAPAAAARFSWFSPPPAV